LPILNNLNLARVVWLSFKKEKTGVGLAPVFLCQKKGATIAAP